MQENSGRKAIVSAIAAIGRNRELGKRGDLIWRISDDLKRLKLLTTGHMVIMGRKTYESIGKPLPNRTNLVVTRNPDYILAQNEDTFATHALLTPSVTEAIDYARKYEPEEIFILGGAEIYTQVLPHTDRLYLTLIDATDPEADTFFPDYSAFKKVISEESGRFQGYKYKFITLEKP